MLTLRRDKPARRSGAASSTRRSPLVVIARSSRPSAASRSTSATTSLRTVGSPPVRRTRRTPKRIITRTSALDLLEARARRRLRHEVDALFGHAVDAAIVAAIGERHAQVGHGRAQSRRAAPAARARSSVRLEDEVAELGDDQLLEREPHRRRRAGRGEHGHAAVQRRRRRATSSPPSRSPRTRACGRARRSRRAACRAATPTAS